MEVESKSTTVLVIVNGLGVYKDSQILNKVNTPNLHKFINTYPTASLYASGKPIGLKEKVSSNSKIGATVLGSGRPYSDLNKKINTDLKKDQFLDNEALEELEGSNKIHLVGDINEKDNEVEFKICSKLIDFADENSFTGLIFHLLVDDQTSKVTAKQFIDKIEQKSEKVQIETIVKSDLKAVKNRNWNEIKKMFDAVVSNKSDDKFENAGQILDQSGSFVASSVENIEVEENDSFIFFNADFSRVSSLAKPFYLPVFKRFKRNVKTPFTCISINSFEKNTPISSFYSKSILHNSLTETISKQDKKQLHISDPNKFAYLNFYFNGGISEPFAKESRELVSGASSFSKVSTENLTNNLYKSTIENLHKNEFDLVVVLLPEFELASSKKKKLKSLNLIDKKLGKIAENVLVRGGSLVITSDYSQQFKGSKNKRAVPFLLVDNDYKGLALPSGDPPESNLSIATPVGSLKDVSPTILDLMGLKKSDSMEGESLLKIK